MKRRPLSPPSLPGLDRLGRSPAVVLAGVLLLLGGLLLAPALIPSARAGEAGAPGAATGEKMPEPTWPDATLDAFAKLPVQDGGRVKPFYTWASYVLLRANHQRSCRTPAGRKLDPVAWALDVMFHPDVAKTYRCFLVETNEITDAIGVEVSGKKKRDRYSYEELFPTRQARIRLGEIAQTYAHKDERDRTNVEGAIIALDHAVDEFEGILHYLDFARTEIDVSKTPALVERFGKDRVAFSDVLGEGRELVMDAYRAAMADGASDERLLKEPGFALVNGMADAAEGSRMLAILAPTPQQSDEIRNFGDPALARQIHPEEWLSPHDAIIRALRVPVLSVASAHVEILQQLEAMWAERGNAQASAGHAETIHRRSQELATATGEYDKIEMEVFLQKSDLFTKALVIFLLAFVLVAVTWFWPNRWLTRSVWALLIAGAAITITGITIRSVLRERPPVSTLYDTVLFITAFFVVAGMVVEKMNKQRIALALAPVLGAIGLLVANRYEMVTKQDTLPRLLAVLDTNFWLTTHVITITIGYAASLLAAAVGHVYVLGKVFGVKKDNPQFYRTLTGMLYGTLAFALIFSVVGTILGGIWANDSWGRFWGWDPKENGALIIVLWQLAMIHARLGGLLKPFGLAMSGIALGGIVVFSWWGVNLLGIGLHTYGFASGVSTALYTFYGIEVGVVLLGAGWWWSQHVKEQRAAA